MRPVTAPNRRTYTRPFCQNTMASVLPESLRIGPFCAKRPITITNDKKVGFNMKTRRILMSLAGVFICAVSVGIFKIAALGVDPFQSLMSGLDHLIPISFGTLYVLVNLVLLVFSLIADRRNIGIATFLNLFLLGYITQFTYELLRLWLPAPSLLLRALCLATGIVVICFGSSLYMTANLGVSTYDAIAVVLSGKWKLGQFQYVRICCDLVCVLLGTGLFLLSGGTPAQIPAIVGIGTVITAFFMGPLIQFFNNHVAIPFLEKSR